MAPTDPPENAMGTNTALSTTATPTRAPVICPIALRVASRGDRPCSDITRSTFSTTTIASSTSSPIASTRPNIDSVLIVNRRPPSPERSEQHDRHRNGRNQRRTQVLQEQVHHQEDQRTPSNSVFTTSVIEIFMNGVVS